MRKLVLIMQRAVKKFNLSLFGTRKASPLELARFDQKPNTKKRKESLENASFKIKK